MSKNVDTILAYRAMRAVEKMAESGQPEKPKTRRQRLTAWLDKLIGA